MNTKLPKIKLFAAGEDMIVAPKAATSREVIAWYEKNQGVEPDDMRLVSLTDKRGSSKTAPTWGQVIEATDFETADLPLIL